jgi:hypothetical protein
MRLKRRVITQRIVLPWCIYGNMPSDAYYTHILIFLVAQIRLGKLDAPGTRFFNLQSTSILSQAERSKILNIPRGAE